MSQSFEEFGTDAEQQLWWGFGFYLQVGGAATSCERSSAGSVHVCEKRRRRRKGKQEEREKALYGNCMFSELEAV